MRTGQRGELRLAFELRGGRTVLAGRHASAPFGAVKAFYPGGSDAISSAAEVQVTNPAGGILGGDNLSMEVSLGPGSCATIVTQGAGKAYRGPRSSQDSVFEMGDGTMLEYLPHHIIPYGGSSFSQKTEFRLAPDATLIAWDAFSAGRVARGERFAFDSLSSFTGIERGGKPEIVDGLDLRGGEESFGGYSYLAAVYVLAPVSLREASDRVSIALGDLPRRPSRGLLASASEVSEGCSLARILSDDAQTLYDTLNLCRGLYQDALGHSPARGVR